MDFATIEVAFLAGLIALISFTVINIAVANPLVVTPCDWKAIDDIDRMLIERFPGFSNEVKEDLVRIGQAMQTKIEATFTQHMHYVAVLIQETAGLRLAATKVKRSYQCNCHNLCIADPALEIFVMVKSFQKIVIKAENCYNLAIHVASWFRCGFSNCNFTRSHMEFSIS